MARGLLQEYQGSFRPGKRLGMREKCHQRKTAASGKRLLLWTGEERGAELVEFAFVLPMLLMLLTGIFWIGRAFNVYQTVTRAAREGARYAVLPSCATCGNTVDSAANVQANYVNPALQASALDPAKVTNYSQTTQWLENTSPQQCGVVIAFTYPVQLTIPFTSLNAATVNISTQVQMRMENVSVDASGNPTCP